MILHVTGMQLERVAGCKEYPEHVRQIACELAAARKALQAARVMLAACPTKRGRTEPSERTELREALDRYDHVRAAGG